MDRRPLAAALAALVLSGCGTSSPPEDQAWVESSVQVLDDVAGAVASGRLALDEEQKGHFVGRYGLVLAQDSEGSAAGAARAYLSSQPAAGRADDFRQLAELLRQAESALIDARMALATGAEDEYAGLEARLEKVGKALEQAAEPLRSEAG